MRRLPLWMSRSAATVGIETSELCNVENQSCPLETSRPENSKNKDILWSEATTLETKKLNRKRKKTDDEASTSFGVSKQTKSPNNELKSKKGGKVGKRKMKLMESTEINATESFQECDNLASLDGKMVLTVDDLISIAQEYVDADAKMSRGQRKTETIIAAYDSRAKAVPLKSEEEDVELEGFTMGATRTDDVAQDMLNLFLGPLLQKPGQRERKHDDAFALETTKPSASDEAALKAVEAPAPSEKKKCSLKDKVSVFLD